MALTAGQSPTLYAATLDQGVLATSNGQDWVNANGSVNGALPTTQIAGITFDPLSGDRYVAPNGAAHSGALYAATDRGLFKSIDGGVSSTASH